MITFAGSAGSESQFLVLLARTVCFLGLHVAALVAGYFLLAKWYRDEPRASARAWLTVSLAVGAALVFAISEPQSEWFGDFVEAYYQGGAALLQGIDEVPKAFAQGVHGFVNIPILAFPFAPFALMPKMTAAIVYLVLGLLASVFTWLTLVRGLRFDAKSTALLGLLFALNGPLHNSLREGNTSHFALLACVLALFQLRERRDFAAGALIATAALFKLPLLLFGLYFLLRRRYRAVLGGAVTFLGSTTCSVALFGWDAHVQWYERFVASAGDNPIGAFNVQSIPALLLRFERAGEVICNWAGFPLSAANRFVSLALSTLLLGGVLLSALLPELGAGPRRPPTSLEEAFEFSCVLVLACVTSPLAWSHYYCWMLLPLALLLAPGSAAALGRQRPWLALAAVAVSVPVLRPWCSPRGIVELPYLVVLSHYLLGGIALLALLAICRFRLSVDRRKRHAS